ncbi:flavodoxin family protein [Methanobrevibacter sp.]|uniref:flavodoxin family protein n=1 Tax=Methanobrevibacter sp. TaxID=66852 RepID=UPI0025F74830|nr:flavodoxin family protein [Methanobrevibacter sp.]MBR4448393.1 flavodoxin family protein [Methanobrevibacter sp.]
MKAIVINADPKRKGINAQFAKSALKGAESVGAEVEYIDLYKLELSGCRVCLICKRDDEVCKCYWRDELSPLIEDIFNADALLVAAPIFFSHPSSHYMALLERMIYSMVSYKTGNKFKGKVNVGLFYTINYPKDYFEKSIRPHLKQSEDLLKMLNGKVVIESFSNISKNDYSTKSEEEVKLKEEQLSLDLDKVFEIGAELSK